MNDQIRRTYKDNRRKGIPARYALSMAKAKAEQASFPFEFNGWEELDDNHQVRFSIEPDYHAAYEEEPEPWADGGLAGLYEQARRMGYAKGPAWDYAREALEQYKEDAERVRRDGWSVVIVEVRNETTGHVGTDALGGIEPDGIVGAIIEHDMVASAQREADRGGVCRMSMDQIERASYFVLGHIVGACQELGADVPDSLSGAHDLFDANDAWMAAQELWPQLAARSSQPGQIFTESYYAVEDRVDKLLRGMPRRSA